MSHRQEANCVDNPIAIALSASTQKRLIPGSRSPTSQEEEDEEEEEKEQRQQQQEPRRTDDNANTAEAPTVEVVRVVRPRRSSTISTGSRVTGRRVSGEPIGLPRSPHDIDDANYGNLATVSTSGGASTGEEISASALIGLQENCYDARDEEGGGSYIDCGTFCSSRKQNPQHGAGAVATVPTSNRSDHFSRRRSSVAVVTNALTTLAYNKTHHNHSLSTDTPESPDARTNAATASVSHDGGATFTSRRTSRVGDVSTPLPIGTGRNITSSSKSIVSPRSPSQSISCDGLMEARRSASPIISRRTSMVSMLGLDSIIMTEARVLTTVSPLHTPVQHHYGEAGVDVSDGENSDDSVGPHAFLNPMHCSPPPLSLPDLSGRTQIRGTASGRASAVRATARSQSHISTVMMPTALSMAGGYTDDTATCIRDCEVTLISHNHRPVAREDKAMDDDHDLSASQPQRVQSSFPSSVGTASSLISHSTPTVNHRSLSETSFSPTSVRYSDPSPSQADAEATGSSLQVTVMLEAPPAPLTSLTQPTIAKSVGADGEATIMLALPEDSPHHPFNDRPSNEESGNISTLLPAGALIRRAVSSLHTQQPSQQQPDDVSDTDGEEEEQTGPPPPMILRILLFPLAMAYLAVKLSFKGIRWFFRRGVPKFFKAFGRLLLEGFRQLCRALAFVGHQLSIVWPAIRDVLEAIGRGLGVLLKIIFKPIWQVLRFVSKGIWEGLSYAAKGIWSGLTFIGRGISTTSILIYDNLLAPIGRAMRTSVLAIGHGISVLFKYLWMGISKAACHTAQAVSWVGHYIYHGLKVVVGTIWTALSVIGVHARTAFLFLWYNLYQIVKYLGRSIWTGASFLGHHVWRIMTAIARPIGSALHHVGKTVLTAISFIGRHSWTGVTTVAKTIASAVAFIGMHMYKGTKWLAQHVLKELCWVGRGIRVVIAGLGAGFNFIGIHLWKGIAAIGKVLWVPIAAFAHLIATIGRYTLMGVKSVGNALSTAVRFVGSHINGGTRWLAQRLWWGFCYVGRGIKTMATGIGSAFKFLGTHLSRGTKAVARFIWIPLAAIGRGVATTGRHMWNGVKAVGRGIRVTGVAFKGMLAAVLGPIFKSIKRTAITLKQSVGAALTSVKNTARVVGRSAAASARAIKISTKASIRSIMAIFRRSASLQAPTRAAAAIVAGTGAVAATRG